MNYDHVTPHGTPDPLVTHGGKRAIESEYAGRAQPVMQHWVKYPNRDWCKCSRKRYRKVLTRAHCATFQGVKLAMRPAL